MILRTRSAIKGRSSPSLRARQAAPRDATNRVPPTRQPLLNLGRGCPQSGTHRPALGIGGVTIENEGFRPTGKVPTQPASSQQIRRAAPSPNVAGDRRPTDSELVPNAAESHVDCCPSFSGDDESSLAASAATDAASARSASVRVAWASRSGRRWAVRRSDISRRQRAISP